MADFEAERVMMREARDAWFPRDGVKAVHVDITVEDGHKFSFEAFPTDITVEWEPPGFVLILSSTGRLARATDGQADNQPGGGDGR